MISEAASGALSLKVEEIRPDAFLTEHRRALAEDVGWLTERAAGFVPVDCPACGDGDRHRLYEKYGLRHVVCTTCGTQYVSPRPSPALLAEFYARSAVYRYWSESVYPTSAAARRERIFRPRARIVDEICAREGLTGGTLVEIGAAYGLFCEEVRALGRFARIVAVEPVPNLASICRSKGFEVVESAVEQANLSGPVDLICSFEVIEHLFSPVDLMRELFGLLRPGGYVMLSCPNIQGFDTTILGSRSETVDHEHLNYFSPVSLRRLAERVGFEAVSVTTPGELDVEIVTSALREGVISRDELGPFLPEIVDGSDRIVADRFQAFLAASCLSSSMLFIARKP